MSTKVKKGVPHDIRGSVDDGDKAEIRKANFLEKICDFSERFEKTAEQFDHSHIISSFHYLHEEVRETIDAYTEYCAEKHNGVVSKNEEDVLDGYCDTAFVALAGAYKYLRMHGHNSQQAVKHVNTAMLRVCNANLKKEHPEQGIVRNDAGKVQKPEGWQEPRFADLLGSKAAAEEKAT